MSSFEKLGVIPELIRSIEDPEVNWLLPTPVQDEAIPLILGGGDVMVAAETGSGKTAAFALPILQTVYESLRGEGGYGDGISAMEYKSNEPINKFKSKNISKNDLPIVILSKDDCDEFFYVSDNGLIGQSRASWQGGRTNIGVLNGKYYFEVTVIKGLARIGWCTMAHTPISVGTDQQSYGYGGTAKKAYNGQFINYGKPYKESDTIGCMIDFEQKLILYSLNGEFMGPAFNNIGKGPWFPCATIKDGSLLFNFGRGDFKCLPKGFLGIQSAPISDTNYQFNKSSQNRRGDRPGQPLSICVAPTRDLAQQIYDDFTSFTKYLKSPPVLTALAIGGVGKMVHEIKKAHIVVGTMGSLKGLVQSKIMSLKSCKFFVIDEADRVLDKKQGNQSDILALYSRLPMGVQVMLFSATLHSDDITIMSSKICRNPQWVDLKGKEYVPDTVHHCILVVNPVFDRQWVRRDKYVITDGVHLSDRIQYNNNTKNLSKLSISEGIKLLKPLILKKIIDAFEMDQCLVFCRTRLDCNNIAHYLTQLGGGRKFMGGPDTGSGIQNKYSCAELHSGIPQGERHRNLDCFKKGAVRFLICTDVAARGIDIKQLPYVINVTLPAESEDYIHRVGRVGRADEHGVAISIVSKYEEKVWYHKCASRGANCTDTRLVDEGGCTIWYNEPDIFRKVETRLGGISIPELKQNQLKHDTMAQIRQTIELKDPLILEAQKKVENMIPRIEELGKLEIEAQKQFLIMPSQFNNVMTGQRPVGMGMSIDNFNDNSISGINQNINRINRSYNDTNVNTGSISPNNKKKKKRVGKSRRKKNKENKANSEQAQGPMKG